MNTVSLSSSAMLLDLSISVYTGRRADRATADEVTSSKGAGRAAATVSKYLFAGDHDLAAIGAYAAACRQRVYNMTLPWADQGTRLLPTKAFFNVTQALGEMEREYATLVDVFVAQYAHKISNAAFGLGTLFNRDEYPPAEAIAGKFAFRYTFSPVPEEGDFRVDVPARALDQLRDSYRQSVGARLEAAVDDAWGRLYKLATTFQDKLATVPEGGRRPRLHESTLDQAKELCEVLKDLNITDDPQLEAMRLDMANTLIGVDIGALRESDDVRNNVREVADSIIAKFA